MIIALPYHNLYKIIKKKLFRILEKDDSKTKISYAINISLSMLIAINVLAAIFETVKELYVSYSYLFNLIENFSVLIFTIEYLLRVWISTENKKYSHSVYGRIRYMFSTFALIDLFAILPFYLALGMDLKFLRVIRLLRILRILKIIRYVKALQIITKVLKEKKEELAISMVLVIILLILVSCVMYHVEHAAQPEAFNSIPETMWWGIATLTTVGYGDVYPITKMGKLLAAIVAVLGIGLFALPTGIIASGFSEEISKKQTKKKINCPHCGEHIEEEHLH